MSAPKTALLSVSDKTGLVEFAQGLVRLGYRILSTGGSRRTLEEAGIRAEEVASHTGHPEIMDGRVKTLHPKIHGGILALRNAATHQAAMRDHGIAPIDLVAVNLYPFAATVAKGADFETCIENIDIGGPAMIRSAAKNHSHVLVCVDPHDYGAILDALEKDQANETLRLALAQKAFAHTARYDAMIADWLAKGRGENLPEFLTITATRALGLRYGENPHQEAALYKSLEMRPGVASASQLQGKELSYNNINDTDAAFELVAEFSDVSACAIIKHANPCGVAVGGSLREAYEKALLCDPVSAFGGIVAFNRALNGEAAEKLIEIFTEVIIAPEADAEARAILATKKNLRLLLTGAMPEARAPGLIIKSVAGGYLAQSRDNGRVRDVDLKTVTRRPPTPQEMADLAFAFTVAKHVKSNAIVYAKNGTTVGIGAGQMSRVDSARIAALKGQEAARMAKLPESLTKNSVAASDAFFPFADGLETVIAAGATAVIQPGGSIRDAEVIAAADQAGIAMVMTGQRHFRH